MSYTFKIAAIRNGASFLLILFLLCGCEFDPTVPVQSADQPKDHTTPDGTTWTAFKKPDATDLGLYTI